MSIHIPSMIGAPFTESSHTKQQLKTIVSKSLQSVDAGVVQNQVPMFSMESTNVVPPTVQTGIPLSMRGTPVQGSGVAAPPPSNLMAGQTPPKPLSAAPAPGKPGSLVLRKEGLSIPIPKNSPVAGTLRIQIPYQNNKPLFEKIKDIIFVPGAPPAVAAPKPAAPPTAVAAPKPAAPPTAVAAPKPAAPPTAVAAPKPAAPPTAVAAPKPAAPPTAVAAPKRPLPVVPPRVFLGGKRVRKYKDGRVVVISRGKAVTTYPDGRRVIMKRNRTGRMVSTTIKPNGVRIITQGRRTILIQPNGQRVITKRGPFGRVTVVTIKTDGTRIVQKGGRRR